MYKNSYISLIFCFFICIVLLNVKGNRKHIMISYFDNSTSKNLTKRTIVNDNAARHKIGHIKTSKAQNRITTPVKDMSNCL